MIAESNAWNKFANQVNRLDQAYDSAIAQLTANPSFDAAGYIQQVVGAQSSGGTGYEIQPLAGGANSKNTQSGNKSKNNTPPPPIPEKWNDRYHGTVVIWINTTNAPGNFDFDQVKEKILEIFNGDGTEKNPGSKIKVVVAKTNKTVDQMSGQLGRVANKNWSILNPPGWHGLTRWIKTYGYHVGFHKSNPGFMAAGNSTYTTLYSEALTNYDLWGTGVKVDWPVAYANIIVHETFWHGLLGNTGHWYIRDKGGWFDEYPVGSLGSTSADAVNLINDIKNFENRILWRLR